MKFSLRHRRYRPLLRTWAATMAACFSTSIIIVPTVNAFALAPKPYPLALGHTRALTANEMRNIKGASHQLSYGTAAGSNFPWEGTQNGVNSGNGNKLTTIPIVGWTALGGLPVNLTLYHNSQSNHNSELGQKWTHSYDIYLGVNGSTGDVTVHWGNDLSYTFVKNMNGTYTPPTGIYDGLVANSSMGTIVSYDLTTKNQVKYHFTNPNSTGFYISTISDLNSNTITINHDSSNYVTTIVDPTSRTITLTMTSGKITSISDPQSRSWSISYTNGDLTQITYPTVSGNSYNDQFSYDGTHCITTHTDRRGKSWTASYYGSDSSIIWEKDPYNNQTGYSFTNGTTTITDPNGNTTVHHYSSGKLTSITDANSVSESYTYDGSLNRTQVVDRRGKTWNYTFDGSGNVLTVTDPLSHVTTMTYNAFNQPLTVTDALSHVVTNTYSGTGRLLTTVNALGTTVVSNSYDSYGQCTSTTDGLSHTTNITYDTDGNADSVTDANSNTVTAAFNALGAKTSVTDALSHSTVYTLDAWNRVTAVAVAGTTVATTTYDANSNVLTVTDGVSNTTTTVYDNANRPTSVTNGAGDVVYYAYDATGKLGLLSTKTDGNSKVTTYSYNSLNMPSSTAYADSTSESWTYNANYQLASHTDGKSQTINYAYDDASRLTTVDYPSGTDTAFTYDNANRRTQMVDSTGTTTWTFDAANRMTGCTTPNGTVSNTYDYADRRTQRSLTGTGNWTYSYDSGNRLTSTTNPYSETTSTSYDAANRVTQVTAGNSSVTLYGYDNLNRTTDVWHKTSGGTTLGRYQYTYDNASNVTQRDDNDGSSTAFGYDGANQLTSEARTGGSNYSISYNYDHNGNRLTKVQGGVTDSYSYGNHDQLTSTSSKSFSYDNNGNCTAVTVGGNTTSLAYDFENRVTGITYQGGATNSFQYNGLGLRTQKVDSAGTFNYVCDGTTPASAVLSDSAAIYTPGLSERRSSTSKFYHGDALSSTRGVTNSSQTATDSKLFDAFGMTVSSSGTTPTPFGFVGGAQYQTDNDSGLMLLGHRYYDASVGRFVSQDPAKAGDNWYAYCSNNPVVRTDPAGLWDDFNDGKVVNKSPNLQFGYGDVDNKRYKIIPTPKNWPLPKGVRPPSIAVPTDPKSNLPWYPVWPYIDGDGHKHYVFPVAPGTTVGDNGVDIDAGWDPIKQKWIKTPGKKLWYPGTGNWDGNGSFHPSPPGDANHGYPDWPTGGIILDPNVILKLH